MLPPAAGVETSANDLKVSGHPLLASPGTAKQVGFNLRSRAPDCLFWQALSCSAPPGISISLAIYRYQLPYLGYSPILLFDSLSKV